MKNFRFLFLLCLLSLFAFSCTEEIEKPNHEYEISNLDQPISNRSNCDPCNCNSIYTDYLVAAQWCQIYGGSYCETANRLRDEYYACLNQEPQCPNGFQYDGCNCYSGIHFPDGYNGFVYGNGFYVEQNCQISTANDCCPTGFTFDGANCHYFGLYFPEGYEGFIYNNAFYTTPGSCE